MPTPVGVRAEATADNTSIRVSWQWSRDGLPICVDRVQVHYQPERGSQMMYTVNNTTVTSATLPNLQCNMKYTVWVHAYVRGGHTGKRSVSRKVSLPATGMIVHVHHILCALADDHIVHLISCCACAFELT